MNIKEYLIKQLEDTKSSNNVNSKSVECFISYLNEISKLEIDNGSYFGNVVIDFDDIIVLYIYDKDDSLDIGIRFEIDGTLSINKEHSFKVKNENELSNAVLGINNLFK